jgi:hypothetical protein
VAAAVPAAWTAVLGTSAGVAVRLGRTRAGPAVPPARRALATALARRDLATPRAGVVVPLLRARPVVLLRARTLILLRARTVVPLLRARTLILLRARTLIPLLRALIPLLRALIPLLRARTLIPLLRARTFIPLLRARTVIPLLRARTFIPLLRARTVIPLLRARAVALLRARTVILLRARAVVAVPQPREPVALMRTGVFLALRPARGAVFVPYARACGALPCCRATPGARLGRGPGLPAFRALLADCAALGRPTR